MSQYVLARITNLTGVNLALFDYDRHNALYYFVLNANEEIYLRYGGRDAESPVSYLDLGSIEIALQHGLDLHQQKETEPLDSTEPMTPFFPREIPMLNRNVILRGQCVECHLVADYTLQEKELHGTLDKLNDMYVYPDIKSIGIFLDVPKGLRVDRAEGAVADAGMKAGDIISKLDDTPVYTFGDLQHRYHKVSRESKTVRLEVIRNDESVALDVSLPEGWWETDLTHRYWTVDPLLYFNAKPLTDDEKVALELPIEGFASRVDNVAVEAVLEGYHSLQEGDVIYAVNQSDRDSATRNVVTSIKLRLEAGAEVTLGVIRGEERLEVPLSTQRQFFRKQK